MNFRIHPPGPVGRSRIEFKDRTSLTFIYSLILKVFPISLYVKNSTESGRYLQAQWSLLICGGSHRVFQVSLMVYLDFREMVTDEANYPNSRAFYPERFLGREGADESRGNAQGNLIDPTDIIYGFGRRQA